MNPSDMLLVPALDAHRFVARGWWTESRCRERVDRLRYEAALGRRRPFQIVTCTAGGTHLREVARSFIELIEQAGLGETRVADRPLLRWLLVERERCPSIDTMANALTSSGVEVQRRPASTSADASIADGRRAMLQAVASLDLSDAPIVLLLDDDLAFDALYSGPEGVELGAPWPWLPAIWAYHEAHPEIDVALGGVSGAPPLPASSTLATNLLDLDAALHGEPGYVAAQRWSEVDHYYDLSPVRTISEPYPLLESLPSPMAMLDALMIHGTLARPLVATPTTLAQSRPAPVVRGGNTVVFDPSWLSLPHPQAQLDELRLRRADTVWAQTAVSLHGCRLGQLLWPLRHLRDERGFDQLAAMRWRERLLADLGGVGLYRGIERWRTRAAWRSVDELQGARADVFDCVAQRRVAVADALHDAQRRCTGLLGRRPELATVGDAIEQGLAAIAALELEPDAIGSMLDGLSASLQAHS